MRSRPWLTAGAFVSLSILLPGAFAQEGAIDRSPVELGSELSLQEAIDLALHHNLDLQIQRSSVDDAEQQLQIARSDFDPTLGGAADSTFRESPGSGTALDGAPQPQSRSSSVSSSLDRRLPTGATVGITADILDRSKTNSSFRTLNPQFNSALRLQVRQPILKNAGFQYNLSNLRVARLGIDESNQQLMAQTLELLRDTEIGYWSVVAFEAERDITERSIELSERIVLETTERKKAALATETDILEAASSLAERQEALLQTQANVEEARDALFQRLGLLRRSDPMAASFEQLPPRVHLECDPQASFAQAETSSPALLVAELQTARREEETARQRNQLRPQLDVVASTGLLGQDGAFGGAHRSLQDFDGHFWDAGFEVSIPLGNRLERARYAQTRNALTRAQMAEENVRIDLYAVIRAACREVELARESFEASGVTLDFTERRLAQQRENYQQGQVTIREVLEAQNDLDAARLRQLRARIRELNAIVQLAEVEGTLPERYGLHLGGAHPDS